MTPIDGRSKSLTCLRSKTGCRVIHAFLRAEPYPDPWCDRPCQKEHSGFPGPPLDYARPTRSKRTFLIRSTWPCDGWEVYGGEIAIILYFDALAHVERRDDAWTAERDMLRSRGAFTSIGVPGAFAHLLPSAWLGGTNKLYPKTLAMPWTVHKERLCPAET
jgi:hypothetical protein